MSRLVEGQFIKTVKGHGKIIKLIPTHFGYNFKLELPDGGIVNCHESDIVKE